MTTLQLVDALRGVAVEGDLHDLAASHIEDLAAAVDDMALALEGSPVLVWEGVAYRCIPAALWDSWVEAWAIPCAVCGERRCLHDPSIPGPEVVPNPCAYCDGTGLRGYSMCPRCEGWRVEP